MPNVGHQSQRIVDIYDQRWLVGVAERQDGLLTVDQMREHGIQRATWHAWHRAGRLHPVEPGVYALGHRALSPRGKHRAALLSAGEAAALSHSSALRHAEIADLRDRRIHVLVPRGSCAPRGRIVVHRTTLLDDRDVRTFDGLRCTTVARTLIDLAGSVPYPTLAYACRQVEYARQLDVTAIGHTLARMNRPPGVRALRRALAAAGIDGAILETRLEHRALVALLAAGLPQPVTQEPFDLRPDHREVRVDFWYPDARLVVEVDGPHHRLPLQQALDERRDAAFARRGIIVARISDDELDADAAGVADRILRLWSQMSTHS